MKNRLPKSVFTVILQHPSEGTTSSGETFYSFDEANRYAKEWADEEWGTGKYTNVEPGNYVFESAEIAVHDLAQLPVRLSLH